MCAAVVRDRGRAGAHDESTADDKEKVVMINAAIVGTEEVCVEKRLHPALARCERFVGISRKEFRCRSLIACMRSTPFTSFRTASLLCSGCTLSIVVMNLSMTATMAVVFCLVMPYSAWGEHNIASISGQITACTRFVLILRVLCMPFGVGSIRRKHVRLFRSFRPKMFHGRY